MDATMFNRDMWSKSICKRFAGLQIARNLQTKSWVEGYEHLMPKLTLDEKINRFIAYAMSESRIRAAKKIAGNDWPDDY